MADRGSEGNGPGAGADPRSAVEQRGPRPDAGDPGELTRRELVQGLAAVTNARTLYPPAHPRVQQALANLERRLDEWLSPGADSVTLLVIDTELVIDGQPLPSTLLASHGLVRSLQRFGIERLTLTAGVTRSELEDLLDALSGQRPPAGSPHVVLGRVLAVDANAPPGTGGSGPGDEATPGEGSGAGGASGQAGPGGTDGRQSGGGGGAASANGIAGAVAGTGGRGRGASGATGGIDALAAPLAGLHAGLDRLRFDLRDAFTRLDRMIWQVMEATSREATQLSLLAEMRSHEDRLFRHSVTVSLWTLGFARALDLEPASHHDLALAGLLHDIGLLELPAELVFGRGMRNEEDRRQLRTHPVLGAIRLSGIPDMPMLPILVAHEHHVRFDGHGGYPLLGRRPDFAARLVAVVDNWDMLHAATAGHPTPSRRRWVAEGLRQRAGTLLDPELVERFLQLVAAANDQADGRVEAAPRA